MATFQARRCSPMPTATVPLILARWPRSRMHPGRSRSAAAPAPFGDAFAALAAIVAAAGAPLNLADLGQIESLINSTLAIEGSSLDPSIVDGVAEIIAAQNAAILSAAQSHNGIDALAAI